MLKLTNDTISHEDIDKLRDWLGTYPQLTKGPLVKQFEEEWARKVGSKYAVFVNSGSSANLLAASVLKETNALKVMVPALAWSTDLAPIMQLGMEPILVDCNLDDLSVDLAHLEFCIHKYRPDALFLVSVLGLAPNMSYILNLCERHNVVVVEDACESFGTTFNGKYLGSMGIMGTYSLYYSHHLSTVEGGVVVTNDDATYFLLLMMRSHGWDRDLPLDIQKRIRKDMRVDDFNSSFTFYVPGYNLRPTEIQAFIGLRQLQRADEIVATRQENGRLYEETLRKEGIWVPAIDRYSTDTFSSFGWPVLSKNRKLLVEKLREAEIDCRPLICGSLGEQPVYYLTYGNAELKYAKTVHENGLYLPNHHEMSKKNVGAVCSVIKEVEK